MKILTFKPGRIICFSWLNTLSVQYDSENVFSRRNLNKKPPNLECSRGQDRSIWYHSSKMSLSRRFIVATMCWSIACILCSQTLFAQEDEAQEHFTHASLNTRLEYHVRQIGGRSGYFAVDDKGRSIFEHHSDRLLNPASNTKLISTALALENLGVNHRFITRLAAKEIDQGRVIGPLYFIGGGDPSFDTAGLEELVDQLEARGITQIDGPIILDSSYLKVEEVPGFKRYRSDHPFRAPPAALTFNSNVVQIAIAPTEIGKPALIHLIPQSDYLYRQGKVITTSRRPYLYVQSFRRGTLETGFAIRGRITPLTPIKRYWRRVYHPDRYVGLTLVERLRQRKINLKLARVQPGVRPNTLKRLATKRSLSLGELLNTTLKLSINNKAELLFLAAGRGRYGGQATYKKAQRSLDDYFSKIAQSEKDFEPSTIHLINGSGLGLGAKIAPKELAYFLRYVDRQTSYGKELIAAMPSLGVDGTLKRYVVNQASGSVRAKTGTLVSVSALSGIIRRCRRIIYFSFLSSRSRRRVNVRRVHLKMVAALSRFLSHPAVDSCKE